MHRHLRKAVLLVLRLALTGFAAVRSSPPVVATPVELLPDLHTLAPKDLAVVVVRQGSRLERRLRFGNEIANGGRGPLELYPVSTPCNPGTRNYRLVMQRIYQDTNNNGQFDRGVDAVSREVPAGCMVFHPAHRHWHFEDFARYELYAFSGAQLGVKVAESTKVSFGVIDIHRPESDLAGSPPSAYYTTCDRTSTNGLSVGWSDEYPALPDQYLAIDGVPDGAYCLVSTSDPSNRLVEMDDTNNRTGVQVQLAGTTATPLGQACGG